MAEPGYARPTFKVLVLLLTNDTYIEFDPQPMFGGVVSWYLERHRHRLDGPALIMDSGSIYYFEGVSFLDDEIFGPPPPGTDWGYDLGCGDGLL